MKRLFLKHIFFFFDEKSAACLKLAGGACKSACGSEEASEGDEGHEEEEEGEGEEEERMIERL